MTVSVFTVVAGIIALFLVLLVLKSATRARLCVLCSSVSLSWLALLAIHYAYRPIDPVLIAVLMGGSAVGLYYLADKKVKEDARVFRLPFLLTLFVAVYLALGRNPTVPAVGLLGALWAVCGVIYAYRGVSAFRAVADKIISCCKNW